MASPVPTSKFEIQPSSQTDDSHGRPLLPSPRPNFRLGNMDILALPSSFSQYSLISPLFGSGHAFARESLRTFTTQNHSKIIDKACSLSVTRPLSITFQHPDKRLADIAGEIIAKQHQQPCPRTYPQPTLAPLPHLLTSITQRPNTLTATSAASLAIMRNTRRIDSVSRPRKSTCNNRKAYSDILNSNQPIRNEHLLLRKTQTKNSWKRRRLSTAGDDVNMTNSVSVTTQSGDNSKHHPTSVKSSVPTAPTKLAKRREGQYCHSCNCTETPEWRRGPDGARTLCNACGLHYAKLMKKKRNASEDGSLDLVSPKPSQSQNHPIRLLTVSGMDALSRLAAEAAASREKLLVSDSCTNVSSDTNRGSVSSVESSTTIPPSLKSTEPMEEPIFG